MHSDRELLEYAAKAVGGEAEWHPNGQCDLVTRRHDGEVLRSNWRPLTDDGDALRLAVRLRLALDHTLHRCWAMAAGNSDKACAAENYGDDPYAATRRAIVRAAAEIGRST